MGRHEDDRTGDLLGGESRGFAGTQRPGPVRNGSRSLFGEEGISRRPSSLQGEITANPRDAASHSGSTSHSTPALCVSGASYRPAPPGRHSFFVMCQSSSLTIKRMSLWCTHRRDGARPARIVCMQRRASRPQVPTLFSPSIYRMPQLCKFLESVPEAPERATGRSQGREPLDRERTSLTRHAIRRRNHRLGGGCSSSHPVKA